MFRILLALIVGGGVVAFMGIQELRLASHCKKDPTSISAQTLESKGVGDNANIVLKDFVLLTNWVVTQSDSKDKDKWKTIWVPAVPIDGEYVESAIALLAKSPSLKQSDVPPPKNIKIIVKTKDVEDENQLEGFEKQQTLSGLVINDIESLGSKEKEILASQYQGIDFGKCYVIEVGRKPMSYPLGLGMSGGGVAMIALGGLGFLKKVKG